MASLERNGSWERKETPHRVGFEVYENLRDVVDGYPIYKRIERGFADNTSKPTRIIFLGEAGTGKTTVLTQALFKYTGEIVAHNLPYKRATALFFDDFLALTEEQVGPRGFWQGNKWQTIWEDHQYDMLDENIYQGLKKRRTGTLQLSEIVGIGSRNRGQTALRKIAEHFPHILILAFVPNPEIQARSIEIRDMILGKNRGKEMPAEQVEDFLKDRYNMHFDGFNEALSIKERGRFIKKMLRKMANRENIKAIDQEVNNQLEDFKQDTEFRNFYLETDLSELLNFTRVVPDVDRKRAADKIRYFQYLSLKYDIPLTIVYNPLIEGPIHLHVNSILS